MDSKTLDVILKRFEQPDEVRTFDLGRLEIVSLAGMTIGRASYLPGWRWSAHIGAALGAPYCTVEHLGFVLAGHATAAMRNGVVYDLTPGTIFYIPPEPHDSWVVGPDSYISLHFLGAARYATR